MPLTFPSMRVKRQRLFPVNSAKRGGESTTGVEQVVDSGGGYWGGELDVLIDGHDEFLAWEAFVADMRGQFNTVNVPYNQWKRAPWPVDEYGRTLTPWFTRNTFLDGTAYEDPAIPPESEIQAEVWDDTFVGSPLIPILMTQGEPPVKGHNFSVEVDGRHYFHRILEVTPLSGVYHCRVWPIIRVDITVQFPIEFAAPLCEMRFDDNNQGQLTDDGLGYGLVTVKFREAM